MSRRVIAFALILVASVAANGKFDLETKVTFQVDPPSDDWKLVVPFEQGMYGTILYSTLPTSMLNPTCYNSLLFTLVEKLVL